MVDELEVVKRFAARLPVDVVGIIEALGISYQEYPMETGSSGRIEYDEPFCTISVNRSEGPQRRRFTAAHELGHYLLHRDLLDGRGHLDRLYSEGGSANPFEPLAPSHEVQANKFAAALLMPSGFLRDNYDADADNVPELAAKCDVSVSAMKIRLKSLGIRS